MNKPIAVVAHTNSEDLFFAMMNAKSKARVAEEQKLEAEKERDSAIFQLVSKVYEMQQSEKKRIRRNLFILKLSLFGACAAGCVTSAVACIRSGLWYAAIAPIALVAVSAFNLKK